MDSKRRNVAVKFSLYVSFHIFHQLQDEAIVVRSSVEKNVIYISLQLYKAKRLFKQVKVNLLHIFYSFR